jgi:hypothetical protein
MCFYEIKVCFFFKIHIVTYRAVLIRKLVSYLHVGTATTLTCLGAGSTAN